MFIDLEGVAMPVSSRRAGEAVERIREQEEVVQRLRECGNPHARYKELSRLIPGMDDWPVFPRVELAIWLHRENGVDLGVCPYLFILSNGHRRPICGKTHEECNCSIPRPPCCILGEDTAAAGA